MAPAPADAGVTFVRMDLGVEIAATAANVADTTLSTTLAIGQARVATVEHVLAALAGLGIDNCRVEVDGPEVPILDGSAAPFVELVREAGIAAQRPGRRYLVVVKPVEVAQGDKLARLAPAAEFSVDYTVDFDHPLITDQQLRLTLSERHFERELAPARTFCFLRDVQRLQSMGLALGGSLANAIVVDEFSILNPDGLRFPDEFVRHKVMDAVGDLSLLGLPVVGALTARKSGHALNHALVTRLLADATAYSVVRASAKSELGGLQLQLPAFNVAGQVA